MKYSLSASVLLIFLIGCKGDPGPAGPPLSGDITGKIQLYADNGALLQDKSGGQVSIEGSSFSSITTSDGFWRLVAVPAGIHTLVVSKAGFMTTKIFEFQFVGGGTYYWGTISTAQTPSVAVTISQQTGPDANNQYHFRGSLSSADSLSRYVGMIFDTIPIPVSSTISYLFEFDNYVMADSTSFSINWSFDKYLESGYGITPGSKVYLRAYALPRSGYYPSFNPATTKNEIYNPEVKFSNLDTLIAP